MANNYQKGAESITQAEHISPDKTGDNIEAKRVASYIWDGSAWIRQTAAAGGGATEYTDGDATTANPVGGIPVFDNAGTITAVSDTNPLPVDATVNATVDLGDKNIGNATANTQRVVLASDQPVVSVDDNGGSLTVDATSLPLPTGAATAANQQTDALTDTELRAAPVVVDLGANNDVTVTGTVTANAGTGNFNVNLQDGAGTDITSTGGAIDVNIASGSSAGTEYTDGDADATPTGSVAMGTDGTNVYALHTDTAGDLQVDVASSALPSGAATATNQSTIIGHVDGIEALLGTIDADTGNLPTIETNTDFGTVTGGGTETGALRVTLANNSTGVVSVDDNGSTLSIDDGGGTITVDGTVAATQSGTWNVNNISGTVSLPTGAATSALQTTGNSTLSTISTNTSVRGATGTTSSVNDTTTSTQLAASATGRKELFITNTSSATLYVKFGTTASSTSFAVALSQNETFIEDKYTGVVHGVWATDPNDGAAVITVVT